VLSFLDLNRNTYVEIRHVSQSIFIRSCVRHHKSVRDDLLSTLVLHTAMLVPTHVFNPTDTSWLGHSVLPITSDRFGIFAIYVKKPWESYLLISSMSYSVNIHGSV
jgi:hypothetical protein